MALTPIPSLDRTSPTFRADCDAYFGVSIPRLTEEVNATTAALTAMAAGGAFSIPYTFSTDTADADPGAGYLRLGSAIQNASTVARLDLNGSDGKTWTSVLDTFDDSTSTVKGQIRLVKLSDASKWLAFNITALASPVGYKNLTVGNAGSSDASPFSNGDSIVVQFTRTGDKGDTGSAGASAISTLHVREEQASGAVAAAGIVISGSTYRRVLNAVKTNGVSGASLATNQITLPAGIYNYRARAPMRASGTHKLFLYNVTDATYLGVGSNALCVDYSANSDWSQANSEVVGQIVLAAQKVVELRTIGATGTGWGNAGGSGQVEVYTEAFFEKIG